jgi:hypothetical protein
LIVGIISFDLLGIFTSVGSAGNSTSTPSRPGFKPYKLMGFTLKLFHPVTFGFRGCNFAQVEGRKCLGAGMLHREEIPAFLHLLPLCVQKWLLEMQFCLLPRVAA